MRRSGTFGLAGAVASAAFLAVNLPGSTAAPISSTPQLTVELVVQGAPAAGSYPVDLTCTNPARSAQLTKRVELKSGSRVVLSTADLPGFTIQDLCSARAVLDGAQTRYATSQPDRADGSTPPPAGGVIDGPGYVSAKAQANGQTISITHAFVGDLIVSKLVLGAPLISAGIYSVQVRCEDSGFLQTILLANNQTKLVTGIPVGSVCAVTEPNTSGVRFEDNSAIASDGIVTIVATPSTCWDLRNADPTCRVLVTSIHTYNAADQAQDSTTNTIPDDVATTTTIANNSEAASAASPVAPAPVEEPAELRSEEIAYTG
jgi:Domain of unknown function (DUF5979)